MARRLSLQDFRDEIKGWGEYLQKDPAVKIADPGNEETSINEAVDALDKLEAWICKEISLELMKENDLLPSEGLRTGFLAGE